jgi:hypothetical protein
MSCSCRFTVPNACTATRSHEHGKRRRLDLPSVARGAFFTLNPKLKLLDLISNHLFLYMRVFVGYQYLFLNRPSASASLTVAPRRSGVTVDGLAVHGTAACSGGNTSARRWRLSSGESPSSTTLRAASRQDVLLWLVDCNRSVCSQQLDSIQTTHGLCGGKLINC